MINRLYFPNAIMQGKNLLAEIHTWEELHNTIGQGWLIGYVSYEAGIDILEGHAPAEETALLLPRIWFGLYETIEEIAPPASTSKNISLAWQPQWNQQEYANAFAKIHKHIAVGDIYQANLSYQLQAQAPNVDAEKLFAQLYQKQPAKYSALLQHENWSVLSFSPERLFTLHNTNTAERIITTEPMKGTRPQGEGMRNALASSEKDHAELDMITDIHRNDLARVSQTGTVTVQERQRIEELPTVLQASAVITGTALPEVTAADILQALSPAGSITGAPKLRATQILKNIESQPRNVYCGSIGYIAPNGEADFNVAIRTLIQSGEMCYYNVGGGIVFDSTMQSEYEETLTKLQFIL